MAPRARLLALGSAGVMVLGGIGAVVAGGLVGQVLAIALISLGLGGALLLAFLEVGLSEDRDRAREMARARRRTAKEASPHRPPRVRRRGHRRPG